MLTLRGARCLSPSGDRCWARLHGCTRSRAIPGGAGRGRAGSRGRRPHESAHMKAPMSMDWDKLKVFHAAAQAGSFTHAGEQLGLSQSAVSRQVSALEPALGASLFHRHSRRLILTQQGELLPNTAHHVLMKLQATRTKLTDSPPPPNP